ncbi:S-adenosyl-L-methionine-dependent methyltransferase [Tothia fuscella]|uniref:S-adenosyl-L-methionine-dependent methyltransferase n=1 Tax=Tothia fuscella TaxID=1048955 RepID=A0A9P4NNF6_9PEZI|nr:S-adenosyl-L-methionine-dependent methyltransferase [Tothia fuscella]
MSSTEIVGALRRIKEKGESLEYANPRSRRALLHEAKALVTALEPAQDAVLRLLINQPTLIVSIIIAVNSGFFHALVNDGDDPKTVESLAKKIGAEPAFLARIARHLATETLIVETNSSDYAPNAASHLLRSPPMEGMAISMLEAMTPAIMHVPSFFRKTGYKNPTGRTPFQDALNIDEPVFKWALRPENLRLAKSFRVALTVKDGGARWYNTLPVEEILGRLTDPAAILLVDVGGNVGNDLIGLRKTHPSLPGRLILQDLPASIAMLNKDDLHPIEAMRHDFFTPQPVVGAKAYFLKTILHDWNDEKSRLILENLKSAMKPGYSKILINDVVIPNRGAGWYDCSQDILMMLGHGAQERSEEDWRSLIEGIGMQIRKIWDVAGASEKLIEVELA